MKMDCQEFLLPWVGIGRSGQGGAAALPKLAEPGPSWLGARMQPKGQILAPPLTGLGNP